MTGGWSTVGRLWLGLGVLGIVAIGLFAISALHPNPALGVGIAERLTVFPLQIATLFTGVLLLVTPALSTVRRHQRP